MNKLLAKVECAPHEAVPFDVFKSGVFTCCVLEGRVLLSVKSENISVSHFIFATNFCKKTHAYKFVNSINFCKREVSESREKFVHSIGLPNFYSKIVV